MKVFLINLDRDQERLRAADAQLKALGVAYERMPAVNGKELSREEKRSKVNRFRWWCAVGRPMTDGELGCALSHAAVYHRMVEDGLPMACVLEDDVVLDMRFKAVLAVLEKRLEAAKPQVALLSNHSSPDGQLGDGYNGFQSPPEVTELSLEPVDADMFTEGYVVTQAGAAALLRANEPVITCCDWWGRRRRLGLIELYHAFPTVCRQDKVSFETSTQPEGCFDVRKLSRPLLVLYKFSRVLGKTMDWLLICITGR